MDFAASAGLLTVLEPPLLEAFVHNTATQAGDHRSTGPRAPRDPQVKHRFEDFVIDDRFLLDGTTTCIL